MFRLSFFKGFSKQRREFLAATEIAPLKLHPTIERALSRLTDEEATQTVLRNRKEVFGESLRVVAALVIQSSWWNGLSSLIVLGGVLASRNIMNDSLFLAEAIGFATIFFFSRVAQAVIEGFDAYRRAQINRGIQIFLFNAVNKKIAVLDPSYSGLFTTGRLKTLIASDVEAVEDFLSAAIVQWIPAIVMIAILGPALCILAGTTGFIAFLIAVACLPLSMAATHLVEFFQGRAQKEQDKLTTLVGEWIRNVRLVRYLGWQSALERDISRQMHRYSVEYGIKHAVTCVVYGVTHSWWMVIIVGIFLTSSSAGEVVSLGTLFSILWILDHMMNYLMHIPYSFSLYGAAAAGADRLSEFFALPEITRAIDPPGKKEVLGTAVALRLERVKVTFGENVALDLSTVFNLKERTAIIGEVGAGKSVLLELLIGDRVPDQGKILVEFDSGVVAPLWRKDVYESYRSQIAYSPQQPFLSNTTMRLNIDLGGKRSNRELSDGARAAQLSPDLAILPRGFDEEVGEVGINLSGGQKQRVSLARAFVSNRHIFILDDPLSAVDPATESSLMDSLKSASKGMIIVSHRLGELYRCDRVVVLERGKIVEDGAPDLLTMTHDSRFSNFLRAVGG